MALTLMYITNNKDVALIAEKYGVDRIWIDLEVLGKEERQKGMNTVKSQHSVEDIRVIKPLLNKADMMVRVNPWNILSEEEINRVIDAGADVVMLPMWKTVEEVQRFIQCIKGRTKSCLLLETKEAVECLDEVLKISGIDEIHIGLNDLHLSYNMTFMFELLANGMVEDLCKKICKANIPFGFGGIAKVGEGMLPAEKIIIEHYRLGSTRAILSRSFCNSDEARDLNVVENIFRENMKKLRDFENSLGELSPTDFENNVDEIKKIVKTIVDSKRKN